MLATGGIAALGKNFRWRNCLEVLAMTLRLAAPRAEGAVAVALLPPAAGCRAPAAAAKAMADAGMLIFLRGLSEGATLLDVHSIAPGN